MNNLAYKNGEFFSVSGLTPTFQNVPDAANKKELAKSRIRGASYSGFVNSREIVLRVTNNSPEMIQILSGFGLQLVPDKIFGNFHEEFERLFDACQVWIERYGDQYNLANFFNYVIKTGDVARSFAAAMGSTDNLVPSLGVVSNVVTKAVTIANKVASFMKGKTQKAVLDEVGTLDGYILTRFSNVLSHDEIYDQIIDPWKREFKLFSGDIPNVRLSGNYNKEMQRASNYYAAYLTLFEPENLQAWLDGVQAGKTIGKSLLNANGFQYRKNVVPFTKEVALEKLAKAGKTEDVSETPSIIQAGFTGSWVVGIIAVLLIGGFLLYGVKK